MVSDGREEKKGDDVVKVGGCWVRFVGDCATIEYSEYKYL